MTHPGQSPVIGDPVLGSIATRQASVVNPLGIVGGHPSGLLGTFIYLLDANKLIFGEEITS
jgi:hypothetical protein